MVNIQVGVRPTEDSQTRPFGFWMTLTLIIGTMVGSGIFILPATLAPLGWTAVFAWIPAIIGVVGIARCIAALSREGDNIIAIIVKALGPFAGLMAGWGYWVGGATSNAALSIAAAAYLGVIFPSLHADHIAGAMTAVSVLAIITGINLLGPMAVGQFQLGSTLIKLIPLLLVVILFLALLARGAAQVPPLHLGAIAPIGIVGALALTLFPLLGFENASCAAERVQDAGRIVPMATMFGTIATGVLYMLVCTAMLFSLDPAALHASSAPFSLFAATWLGSDAARIIACFAMIAAIGSQNANTLVVGEVPLRMAERNLLPRWFRHKNARDVPERPLLLGGAFATLLILANATSSLGAIFTFVALLSSCTAIFVYGAICIAALKQKRAPIAAGIGLLFCAVAFWGSGWQPALLSTLLLLGGLPLYWLRPTGAPTLSEQTAP